MPEVGAALFDKFLDESVEVGESIRSITYKRISLLRGDRQSREAAR